MSTVDFISIIEAFLRTSGTPLYELIAARTFADPTGFDFDFAGDSAVTFSTLPSAGPMEPAIPVERVEIAFQCWATTPKAAMAVARALQDTICITENETVSIDGVDYRIHYARRDGSLQGPFPDERDTRWHFAYTTAYFQIHSEPWT